MTVTIRVTIETELESTAKILTLTELPAKPRPSKVRAAVGAVLAEEGLHGALRRYHRQLRGITNADELRAHQTDLATCRTLAAQAFPTPKARRRTPRPAPLGQTLIDVLTGD
jgi:hypothetical protein